MKLGSSEPQRHAVLTQSKQEISIYCLFQIIKAYFLVFFVIELKMDNMKVMEKLHSTQLLMMVAYLALQLVGTVIIAADDQAAPSPAPALPPKLQLALPGCPSTCGGVEVPYPFGIGNSSIPGDRQAPCYLEDRFNLTCENSKLYVGDLQVFNIDIFQGQMDVSFYVSRYCSEDYNQPTLDTAWLSISSKENKFVTIGCDSYGYLNSYYAGDTYTTGCLTRCYGHTSRVDDGPCSGIGCCQVDIPPRMRNITIEAYSFNSSEYSFGDCTYSFVVKKGNYDFSPIHLVQGLPSNESRMVLDWTVGDQRCGVAPHSGVDYACRNNSHCNDTDTDIGYRCICDPGYEGNPYHPLGCTDINECETTSHTCTSKDNCVNTDGSHRCFCPKGQFGNGTKEGTRCYGHNVNMKIVIGPVIGAIVLFVGTVLLFIYQKRKLIKLNEKFFEQINGGLLLLQQLSKKDDSPQSVQVFTEGQLKKATNNYDQSLIIGRGGFGTVFKGFLPDNRIIAIKKSKITDASQINQFINEMVVLSQINHRNVVKLLGCCLQTEVPLLVYEYVSNGTLFDFLHTEGNANNATWETRLRIAAEVAGALSYLHSAASIPIIHRDVKSANILLDDTYTAKVSDFGASKLVPLDQTEIATMVQGTLGYLDPELMQTQQLTEKSDVYSFGVVLVELLTGEKPISIHRIEERRSLAVHFLSCLKEDRVFEVIQDGILNEENKQEIKEVVVLASKCLRPQGKERPSMKEVAMELEGMRLMEKHSWINADQNLEETRYLLHEASSSSTYELGHDSKHEYNGRDSLKDHVQLVDMDDGR